MAVQLSSRFKRLVLLLVVVGGGYYALRYASRHGMIPQGKQSGSFRTTQTTGKVSNASSEPITVCVVTWPGYAGGEYFNGGFPASADSRFYPRYGLKVAFHVGWPFVP